ncbi:hypothetical protein ScPMuIL_013979 [Solemya velum]
MAEGKEKVDDFSSRISEKDKDPWKPIQTVEMIPTIPLPISSPVGNIIPPERYIYSLEKRLDKLKNRGSKDPTSKDILKSLSEVKDDTLARFVTSGSTNGCSASNVDEEDKVSVSDLQKRMYLDCKAAVPEETVILVRDDILDKNMKRLIKNL